MYYQQFSYGKADQEGLYSYGEITCKFEVFYGCMPKCFTFSHPVFSPYALKGPFPTFMQGARLFFSLEPPLLFK